MTKTKTLLGYPVMMFLCGMVWGEASHGHNAGAARDEGTTLAAEMVVQAENGESVEQNRDRDDDEIKRKRFKVVIAAAGVIVGGVFLFAILLSLTRVNRAIRRLLGIGKKEKPTEYVDAWSNYRLEEESDEQRSADDG